MLRLQGVAANGLMMYTIKICAFRQQEKRQICCYHISAIIHWSRSWIYQKKIDWANVIEIDGHQLSQLDSKNSTSIAASAAEIAEKNSDKRYYVEHVLHSNAYDACTLQNFVPEKQHFSYKC